MFTIIIILLSACAISTNWGEYKDNKNHFTIKHPDDWMPKASVNTIAFLSPREGENDNFQENVNVMIQDLSKHPQKLEQYTEITQKQVVDNLGEAAIISLKATTLSGHKSMEFIYNMDYKGKRLKIKQYWFVKDTAAYLFTYTAEPLQFDKHDNIATKIITSFKLLN